MCGHLTKRDKERWAQKTMEANAKAADTYAGDLEYTPGAELDGQKKVIVEKPKSPPGSGSPKGKHMKQAGRDLVECTPAERAAHRQAMLDAHKNRFKDAHWTHTIPIIESAKAEDVYKETVCHRLFGSNKKFVVPTQHPTRSRAPRDVDNHLFTGAVHKEAESEQEIIARKIENHELEISDHHGREALKDEMDDLRRERRNQSSGVTGLQGDGEVPI